MRDVETMTLGGRDRLSSTLGYVHTWGVYPPTFNDRHHYLDVTQFFFSLSIDARQFGLA